MKVISLLLVLILSACNGNQNPAFDDDTTPDLIVPADTAVVTPDTATTDVHAAPAVYANERFKNVTVEKTGTHTYTIKGKAQVFEAAFSWMVEDGHNELKYGHEMTDASAPKWGNFSFTADVEKPRQNSTLYLILFEVSAKTGSRQHMLPVVLQ